MATSERVWVLRFPAGDERPHLVKLDIIPNADSGWDDPVPNLLAFWGREGWVRRVIVPHPKNQTKSIHTSYWTTWRGHGQSVPLNKYLSCGQTKIYGDAFFVAAKTDWSQLPRIVEYRDVPHGILGSDFVRNVVENHGAFGAKDHAAA